MDGGVKWALLFPVVDGPHPTSSIKTWQLTKTRRICKSYGEKVERAIQSLKGGKSQRADIIAELFKDGGEEITKELTTLSKNLDSQAVVIRVDAVTGLIPAEEDKREAMSEL